MKELSEDVRWPKPSELVQSSFSDCTHWSLIYPKFTQMVNPALMGTRGGRKGGQAAGLLHVDISPLSAVLRGLEMGLGSGTFLFHEPQISDNFLRWWLQIQCSRKPQPLAFPDVS